MKQKVIHFNSGKDRLDYLKGRFEEVKPVEVIPVEVKAEEEKPKAKKKGKKKKEDEVQAE